MASAERLRTVAGALYAREGFGAVSLRRLTVAAGVNLAAVSYHFGSRDGLVEAVVRLTLEPLHAKRLQRLEEIHATPPGTTLESVLGAFLRPAVPDRRETDRLDPGWREPQRDALRLVGRICTDPDAVVQRVRQQTDATVLERFRSAIRPLLPHLSEPEVAWRWQRVVGTFASWCLDPGDDEPGAASLTALVVFLAAALRAAPPGASPDAPLHRDR